MVKQLLKLITSPSAFGLIGVLVLSVLVWLLGPRVNVMGGKPFDPVWVRLAVIGAIVGIYGVVEAVKWWRKRKRNQQLVEDLAESEELVSITAGGGEESALRERFADALEALKDSGSRGQFGDAWLYDLPWYLVIGPPGAGKTTLLRNSGLEFPLAERLGNAAIQGVGGTRNCDWWFTNKAVILDTAGRYTTQDINAESDRAAWRSFLKLLKEHRPRRPVNGVILGLSIGDLLHASEDERTETVQAVRQRLQELMRSFGMRLPVYVLLTKADLLAGLTEHFEDMSAEEREQVWGATFDLDDPRLLEQPADIFARDFDRLIARVQERNVKRLHEERDPERRSRIFTFPHQLQAVKPLIGEFLDGIFRGSRFEMQPILRGVYLTSGTQEGTPVDRLMSAFGRAFGLRGAQLSPFSGQARVFFIRRLLENVIFGESDLVGRDKRYERRLAIIHTASYAAIIGLIAVMSVLWYRAHLRIDRNLADTRAEISDYRQAYGQYQADPTLAAALPVIAKAEEISDQNEGVWTPLLANFGLTAKARLSAPTTKIYEETLYRVLWPWMVGRLEQQLDAAVRNRRRGDYLRQLLALYLGLGTPERYDADALRKWFAADWQSRFPLQPERQAMLRRGAEVVLSDPPLPLQLDTELISDAQTRLAAARPVDQVYTELERDAQRAGGPKGFSLGDELGVNGYQTLSVGTGPGLRFAIPGLYTDDGFYDYFIRRLPTLTDRQIAGDWVMAGQAAALSEAQSEQLLTAVTDRYVARYTARWRQLIEQLNAAPTSDLSGLSDQLLILAGPDSPLDTVLGTIRANTVLPVESARTVQDSPAGANGSGGNGAAGAGNAGAGASDAPANIADRALASLGLGPNDTWPGRRIGKNFDAVNALTDTSSGQAPLTGIKALLADAQQSLTAVTEATDAPQAAYDLAVSWVKDGSNDTLQALRKRAVRAPQPVARMLNTIAARGHKGVLGQAMQHINAAWRRDVLPVCEAALSGRFPVVADADQDMTVRDFTRLFGPGGTFDTFFQTYLDPFINTQTSVWSLKRQSGQSLPLDQNTITLFQRAAQIRKVYFPQGGEVPSVKFTIEPALLDSRATVSRLEVGSREIEYRHGPQRPTDFTWPGNDPDQSVRLTVSDFNGRSRSISFDGPWALFRMFDQVGLVPGVTPDRFSFALRFDLPQKDQAKASTKPIQTAAAPAETQTDAAQLGAPKSPTGPLEAHYHLRARSVVNPFGEDYLRGFACPATL